jgi:hypothetical protein
MNAISANDTAMPAGALERLALFAEWTRTTPPERITEGKGEDLTFSRDLLTYACRYGLNLDRFWLGSERGFVMSYHHAAMKGGVQ